jgi:hypothetical protein
MFSHKSPVVEESGRDPRLDILWAGHPRDCLGRRTWYGQKHYSSVTVYPNNNNNNNNNDANKHAYAGQMNSCTRIRVLLVLHDRGILAHAA